MVDSLSIGGSALLAYRAAMNTVSNNIANVNTAGYDRELTNLQQGSPIGSGKLAGGTGVNLASIERLTNRYAQAQVVSDDSSFGRINTLQTYAAQVDGYLSSADSGLGAPLQSFFNSLNTLSSNPTSSSARESVISDAQTLAGTFNSLQNQLTGLGQQVQGQTASSVTQINSYASQIAQLNVSIAQSTASGGAAPNALLDQRDELVSELSGEVGVNTSTDANGSINVSIANGQSLVQGGSSNTLSVKANAYGTGSDVVLTSAGGTQVDITQQISGGNLGGLQDFTSQVLNPAINQLGQIAATLAQAVNAQQAAGMNQYGALGSPLFSTPTAGATANSGNTGSGSVSATITNAAALSGSDDTLSYNGSAWSLVNSSTGESIPLSGDGSPANPLTGDGLSLTISGTPAAGDRYLIQPTSTAAAQLSVIMTDPAGIAAAAPIQTSPSAANTGTGSIGFSAITDSSNPNLLASTTILFTSATTYSINGAGNFPYTAGSAISANGWSVQISGAPASGDSFSVSANTGSSSDNTNAALLAGLANQNLLANGTNTLSSANAALVSQVGAQDAQATAQLSAVTAVQSQDEATVSAVSGVNLDEEAVSLTEYQQAYQAAAQVISTANSLFDSLLTAMQA